MLDLVFGKKSDPRAVEALVDAVRDQPWTGTLYVGYPVFAGEDTSAVTDALLTTLEHGIVVFDLSSHEFIDLQPAELTAAVLYRQKELRRKLNSRLVAQEELVKDDGVTLAFTINCLTLVADDLGPNVPASVITPQRLVDTIRQLPPMPEQYYRPMNAAVQKTAALRPRKKRLNVRNPNSMGASIKSLESQIANLDKWQKKTAIESPDGPQRIRGLAGSGKTIILALKAAYLHANDPDADIVVTFNTRSLYQQFKNLIRRFYFDQTNDEPDWEKLRVLHAWGSNSEPGLYSSVAAAAGTTPVPFGAARYKYGYSEAFTGVTSELVSHLRRVNFRPVYDYLLIDEAQDFPASFFQLAFLVTKDPKRLVWAYDELQNLNDSNMPTISQLFGLDTNGNPNVEINNEEGKPQQDILLPICYRNPSWLLTMALGLGLGIKRPNRQYAQMFGDPDFWKEIGYDDANGQPGFGREVRLVRDPERSAQFFSDVLTPADSVSWRVFANAEEQIEWIAADINRVMKHEELDANDILIVIPDSINSPAIGDSLSQALARYSVNSHIIGVTASRDVVFVDGSVAMSGIYRAKGNEAPLVYVVGAEYCYGAVELSRRRNMLFTALTRAKAWVRVCGVGPHMQMLANEMEQISAENYELRFTYPTLPEIQRLKSSYREKTAKEKRAVKGEIRHTERLLQRLMNGEIDMSDLPPGLAELLRKGIQ
ncbi:ATP-binding domain-containing protein [Luteimonas sp. SX5]|uniref:ATP-binding domain-containing protein n=1 Tax=Luteimonas galliterrae TaxID=2940486 RepID=A0ABT0MER4_9GAMM|nr:ATP-binding domain-containing protein [Luteimonas galliterrae]MCL1633354.1 ATP-binding domain-containing protein [Luteimonas galliterrae]